MSDHILEFTGERMVPEAADQFTFWEHVYRYKFSLNRVRGKRVLDIACGEGYGSSALTKYGARSVIGVDISPDACQHAIMKYGVDARIGSAENIPLPDKSVDVIVSFETIEHVPNPRVFLSECHRVLDKKGCLILSTPNRDMYRLTSPSNPYHCSEMDVKEFSDLLQERFRIQSLLGQCPTRVSNWSLASLTQVSTIWWNIPILARMLWKIRGTIDQVEWYGRPVPMDMSPALRSQVIELIGRKESELRNLFNPWAVRSYSQRDLRQCVYVVAVAEKQ